MSSKKILLMFISLMGFSFLLLSPAYGQAWDDTDYGSRYSVTVDSNTTADQTDVLVPLTIDTSLTGFATDCCEFKIFNETGSEVAEYMIDSGYGSASTVIWALVPDLKAGTSGNAELLVYFNATTPVSNQTVTNAMALDSSIQAFFIHENAVENLGNTTWTAEAVNGEDYTTGVFGQGFAHGDTTRYINISGTPPKLFETNDFTTISWLSKNGSHASFTGMWDFATDLQQKDVLMFDGTSDTISRATCQAGSGSISASFPTDSAFHMLVSQRGSTGVDNNYTVYLDGDIIFNTNQNNACSQEDYVRADIGRGGNDARIWNGTTDNFMRFDRALDLEEIRALNTQSFTLGSEEFQPVTPPTPPSEPLITGSPAVIVSIIQIIIVLGSLLLAGISLIVRKGIKINDMFVALLIAMIGITVASVAGTFIA